MPLLQRPLPCLQQPCPTRRLRPTPGSLAGLAIPPMLVQELSGAMYLPSGQFDQQQMSGGNDLALGVQQGKPHIRTS